MMETKSNIPVERKDYTDKYAEWLLNYIGFTHDNKSYKKLLLLLMRLKFYWDPSIPLDENRKYDVLSLLREPYAQSQSEWYRMESDEMLYIVNDNLFPITFLEILITLAIRIDRDFMREDNEIDNYNTYFWILIKNLGFLKYDDESWTEDYIVNVVKKVCFVQDRKYDFNGNGGLFPLKNTKEDQRNVQIWNQMCNYINENFMNF